MAKFLDKISKNLKSVSKASEHTSQNAHVKGQLYGVPELSPSNIKFVKILGTGAFSKKYHGLLVPEASGKPSVAVTVRELKANAPETAQSDFRQEMEFLAGISHPNIICLLGVITEAVPMCMVLEREPQASLTMFLRRHSQKSAPQEFSETGASQGILKAAELYIIASQIAAGMEFLASQCYVYNGLMASCCYVHENLLVKISEGEIIQERVHTCTCMDTLLPFQWIPPEMLSESKITIEVNVWSFGVVLWEIFSYGKQPYPGLTIPEVVDRIKSHAVLGCPEGCPSRVYDLMQRCWDETPAGRPSFRDLHRQLKSWEDSVETGHLCGP